MEMNFIEKFVINNNIYNYLYRIFLMPRILEKVDGKIKGKILEIGCGIGKTTEELIRKFPNIEIIAIDYDKAQIKKAVKEFPKKLSNRVKFLEGDTTNLKFKDKSFDAVFEFNALHHIENYPEALSEIHRVLKPKRYFYILDVPKNILDILMLDTGKGRFSKNELIKELKNKGFKVGYTSKHKFMFVVKAKKNGKSKRNS